MPIELIFALTAFAAWGISNFFAKKIIDKTGFEISMPVIHGSVFILSIFQLFILQSHLDITIDQIFIVFVLVLLEFGGYLALYFSYNSGQISVVAPVAASYGIVTTIFSLLFLKENLSYFQIAALIIVFIGIVLISRNNSDKTKFKLDKGLIGAFLVMLFFGLYFPLWNLLINQEYWEVSFTLDKTFLFILSLVYAGVKLRANFTRKLKQSLGYTKVGIFEFIGFAAVTFGLSSTTNSTAIITALSSAYPVLTILLSIIFLKEKLNRNKAIAIVLIITGIILVSIR